MHSVQFFSLTKKIISNCNKKGKGLRFQRQRQICQATSDLVNLCECTSKFCRHFSLWISIYLYHFTVQLSVNVYLGIEIENLDTISKVTLSK